MLIILISCCEVSEKCFKSPAGEYERCFLLTEIIMMLKCKTMNINMQATI